MIWSYPQAALEHTHTHTLLRIKRHRDRNRPSERKDEREIHVLNWLAVTERRWGCVHLCVYVWLCVHICVCMCTLTTASSCHCQCLMELPVGQHFIISVALSIANPSLTPCVCACADVKASKSGTYVCVRVSVCGPLFAITVMCCHMST